MNVVFAKQDQLPCRSLHRVVSRACAVALFAGAMAGVGTTATHAAGNGEAAKPPALASDFADKAPIHPWVRPAPKGAEAYFTNLKNGGTYSSPLLVRFGLTGRGIVPAGSIAGRAGHHHLLVDQPLPLDLKAPLPFNANYVHFGSGQMEVVLDLKPGVHDLRLLLANFEHVLYFVYSKPLQITIEKHNPNTTKEQVKGPRRVELLMPPEAGISSAPFRVGFHASGFNISHADSKLAQTGHFRLRLTPAGRPEERIDFEGGHTEVWLQPPEGNYTLLLELIDNTAPGNAVLATSLPTRVTVPPAGTRAAL